MSHDSFPFLRKIYKPQNIIKKSIYKKNDLLIWENTEEFEAKKKEEIELWEQKRKKAFEKNLQELFIQKEEQLAQETLEIIDELNKNQEAYKSLIIEHCYVVLKEAWLKLTGDLSSENQIKAVLHQLTPKLLSDMYCELHCHSEAISNVETLFTELAKNSPQIKNIQIVEDSKLNHNRIQLQAKRGGTIVVDYPLSVDVLEKAIVLSYKKGN